MMDEGVVAVSIPYGTQSAPIRFHSNEVILAGMNQRNKPKKADQPTKLRVIGGDMRGRPIVYHGAEFTRPMKDNIRENLFNILGRAVKGAIALDMFGGTGALAFESLSRGAVRAVTIERSRHANEFIRKTAENLGVESRLKILTGDAFRLGGQLLLPPSDDTPWIVFLCPPYVLWNESLDDLNRLIHLTLANCSAGKRVGGRDRKNIRCRSPSGGRLGFPHLWWHSIGIHRARHALWTGVLSQANAVILFN